jgi:hypothetical protein
VNHHEDKYAIVFKTKVSKNADFSVIINRGLIFGFMYSIIILYNGSFCDFIHLL